MVTDRKRARAFLYIFDADGTLRGCSVKGQPCPNKPSEQFLLPNVSHTLRVIDKMGGIVGVASNQGGVGLGFLSEEIAYEMIRVCVTEAMERGPDFIRICPHRPDAGCQCRKPKPGMLLDIMAATNTGPERTLYVGDMESDRETAEAAGCKFQFAVDFFWRVNTKIGE